MVTVTVVMAVAVAVVHGSGQHIMNPDFQG